MLAAHLEQRLDIAEEAEAGPRPDPVAVAPSPALGLYMEAAKPHKWHLGGEAIWIGVGFSAAWLVTWVPRHKTASLLATVARVLAGECPVAEYRSFVGALQDVLKATGGGQYRMKGLYGPLSAGGEIEEGPGTLVRLRTQMQAQLTAWQAVLANRAWASMLAHAWLHITCLELIELGLGVVIVGPWLARASRVRLVSDAMAAELTLRARKDDGALAKEARSRALVAVHEVIIAQPEWKELHRTAGPVEVAQRYGKTLLLEDAASRGKEQVIRDVCGALNIQQRKLDSMPQRSLEYLRRAVDAARTAEIDPEMAPTGPHPFGVEAIEHMADELQRLLREGLGVPVSLGEPIAAWRAEAHNAVTLPVPQAFDGGAPWGVRADEGGVRFSSDRRQRRALRTASAEPKAARQAAPERVRVLATPVCDGGGHTHRRRRACRAGEKRRERAHRQSLDSGVGRHAGRVQHGGPS
ncbi:MAG: hypothetical protein SGPRY_002055 [Prymnesium sp.]